MAASSGLSHLSWLAQIPDTTITIDADVYKTYVFTTMYGQKIETTPETKETDMVSASASVAVTTLKAVPFTGPASTDVCPFHWSDLRRVVQRSESYSDSSNVERSSSWKGLSVCLGCNDYH